MFETPFERETSDESRTSAQGPAGRAIPPFETARDCGRGKPPRSTGQSSRRWWDRFVVAPARYLCGLTESEWTPDANAIQDFEPLLGEAGVRQPNEYVVKWAVEEKLADPTVVAADTTAQEAAIPYPNEMGLMAAFMSAVTVASKNVGAALQGFVGKAARWFKEAKQRVRAYRLFAKEKTKAAKDRMTAQMTTVVEKVRKELARGHEQAARLRKHRQVAWRKLVGLTETMGRLVPQIRYWLKTGYVAKDKIISLHIPELYLIVRNKVGKAVEFGLHWGITRLRGGFLLATLGANQHETVDARFAVRAVGMCGQRAVLGFNLNKRVRGLCARKGEVLAG